MYHQDRSQIYLSTGWLLSSALSFLSLSFLIGKISLWGFNTAMYLRYSAYITGISDFWLLWLGLTIYLKKSSHTSTSQLVSSREFFGKNCKLSEVLRPPRTQLFSMSLLLPCIYYLSLFPSPGRLGVSILVPLVLFFPPWKLSPFFPFPWYSACSSAFLFPSFYFLFLSYPFIILICAHRPADLLLSRAKEAERCIIPTENHCICSTSWMCSFLALIHTRSNDSIIKNKTDLFSQLFHNRWCTFLSPWRKYISLHKFTEQNHLAT